MYESNLEQLKRMSNFGDRKFNYFIFFFGCIRKKMNEK